MHRNYLLVGALAAVTAAAACGGSSSPRASAPSDAGGPSPASSAASAATAAGGTALAIAGYAYAPSPLTVAPGALISATNSDSAGHTVTSDTKGLFLGDDIGHGKTVTFKAPTTPGTYTFHCEYHPSMHGTLIVK
jgi:plastocyanin